MDEMNNNGFVPAGDPEADKRAKTTMILGIVSIVCSFCCTYAGLIVGIIGLVKVNGLSAFPELSPSAQSNAKIGKICSIIGIAISVVTIIFNIIMMVTGNNVLYNLMTDLQ